MNDSLKSMLHLYDKPIISNLQGDKVHSVFISYSQGQDNSEAHRTWVAEFARKLSGFAIKVESDMNCDGSKSLPDFMHDGIMYSQYIICVCSDSYVKKSRTPVPRTGVRQEYEIILDRVNTTQPIEQFVIPILKDNSIEKFPEKVPDRFATLNCWDFESDKNSQAAFAHIVARILDIRNLLLKISGSRHPNNRDDSYLKKSLDNFHETVALYWSAERDSIEEEKLRMRITNGEFCKISAETQPLPVHCNEYDANRVEIALTTMGRWDESYPGDQEIFAILSGEKNNV